MPIEDNLRQMLRARNIFSPDNPIPDAPTNINQNKNQNRVREIYQPETRANDMLFEMLDRIPERNKPGALRKIVASMAGLGSGGAEAADRVLYDPYNKEVEDFKTRFEPVREAASLERYSNANERQLAYQSENARIANEREGRLFNQGNLRIAQGDERLAQGNARIEIARDVARGGVVQFADDGSAVMLYKDGTTKPVDANLFSPQEKMQMQQEQALTRIGAQGDITGRNQAALESQRQPNRIALEDKRQAGREALLTERRRVWNLLPLQQKQQIINNYEAMLREDPGLIEFLGQDPETDAIGFTDEIEPSSGFMGYGARPGLSDEAKARIMQRLYQGVNIPRSESTTTTKPTTKPAAEPTRMTPAGKVRVKNPKGVSVYIDMKDLPAALKMNPPYVIDEEVRVQ